MKPPFAAIILSFLVPTMALALIVAGLARLVGLRSRVVGWCAGLGILSFAIMAAPLGGMPIARLLAGVVDHWSAPSTALLAAAVIRQLFGIDLLQRKDWQAAWLFGALAGLFLYPMALGLGPFDPYGLGWHFGPLFVAVAVLASVLILRRNRFGIVLVLAIAAWHLRAVESGNYWDCLIDPFYFVVSVVARGMRAWRICAKGREGPELTS